MNKKNNLLGEKESNVLIKIIWFSKNLQLFNKYFIHKVNLEMKPFLSCNSTHNIDNFI